MSSIHSFLKYGVLYPIFFLPVYNKKVQIKYSNLFVALRYIDTLVKMGGEFGHSLPIAEPRESMSFPINVFKISKCRFIFLFRRDARGAYHLFGGGVIHKTRFMFQRYVSLNHVRMIEFHTLLLFSTHDYIPYDSCQRV